MAAYVVAEVEVTDPAVYEDYRKMVPATVAQYGGRFLVRGGAVETKEGGWQPKRFVVLEFASMDQARKWYHSPEYAPALALRLKAAASDRSISEIVNEAVRRILAEDAADLAAFEEREKEPDLDFAAVVKALKRRGRL